MELKQFAEELKVRMEAEIDTISADQPDEVRRTSLLIESVGRFVAELKRYVVKYKFRSIQEEIAFFKHFKPDFVSRLLYFKKLFKFQLFEMSNPNERKLRFYQNQLKRIQRCLLSHQEFYQYVLSGADENDELYFSKGGVSAKTVAFDERFSTKYDHILSRIRCAELVRSYLLTGIQKIENPRREPISSALTWTGAKTDLVELIYALQALEVFNKGNAGVKQIASEFESMFNVSLGNYYRVFQEIRLRKSGQTKFIDGMKVTLEKKISEAMV
jgi:hypothetical protein